MVGFLNPGRHQVERDRSVDRVWELQLWSVLLKCLAGKWIPKTSMPGRHQKKYCDICGNALGSSQKQQKKKKNESQLMLWRSKVPVLNLIWPCVYIGSYGLEVTYMPNTLCLYQRRPWAINGICYLYLCGITYLGVYRGKKQICQVTAWTLSFQGSA